MTTKEAIKVLRETYCGNEAICELYRIDLCRTTDCEIYHAIKALEADPIVRCKDCKYYNQMDDACPYVGEDGYYKELPGKDDFCSRGARKEVEE